MRTRMSGGVGGAGGKPAGPYPDWFAEQSTAVTIHQHPCLEFARKNVDEVLGGIRVSVR